MTDSENLRRWAGSITLAPPDDTDPKALLIRAARATDVKLALAPPDDIDVAHITSLVTSLLAEYREETSRINPTSDTPLPPSILTTWVDRAAVALADLKPFLARVVDAHQILTAPSNHEERCDECQRPFIVEDDAPNPDEQFRIEVMRRHGISICVDCFAAFYTQAQKDGREI